MLFLPFSAYVASAAAAPAAASVRDRLVVEGDVSGNRDVHGTRLDIRGRHGTFISYIFREKI